MDHPTSPSPIDRPAQFWVMLTASRSLMASRNCCGGSWRIGERDRLLQEHPSVPRNTDSVFRITSPSPGTLTLSSGSPDHQSIPRNTRPSPGSLTLSSGSPVRPQEHPSIPRITRPSPGAPVHPQEHQSVPRITRPSPGSPVHPQDHRLCLQEHPSIPRNTSPSPGTPVHPQDHQNDS
ncbi:hypothetical protein PENNAL_c0126G10396 [Penicillium nalgiovense]|uniref:Uncharacterized protein n=1 Tax=Penicillium nalgiovense TaxID=60175 RepID=A0A1V6X3X9_PENNA|nr:hypothetical protein PENNAL_c0126G10396 [Penicillium nalgiovense]